MAGRDTEPNMAHFLGRLTDVLENMNQRLHAEPTEYQGLEAFLKNNPSKFKGGFNPDGAQLWLEELENIFTVMNCQDRQKVTYAVFVLVGEARNWWHFES